MNLFAGTPEEVWVNGSPCPQVAAWDRGLHYGDGLFETIACVNGRPRLLPLHLQRLASGCARLALPAPDDLALGGEICSLAARAPRAIVKLIVSRGPALARGYAVTGDEAPTRILLRYPWAAEDERAAREGVRVRLGKLQLGENPALARMKHLSRLEQVLARLEWTDPDIAESLLFSSGGSLISGTSSNVFLVHEGKLVTPRLDRCGVAGVMREVIGQLAPQQRIDFDKRPLDARALESAEEIFLTNALTGIRPVRELEGRVLDVGPVTRRLQGALAQLLTGWEAPADV